ncbi:MAG: GAF domain-containing protein, partial [Chloroflexi bacterium]|nr:GAF domain-containing protein [Chloroflexota bacterium]
RQRVEAQREAALAALQRSEERFHITLQNAPITVATLDRDLRYTWVYNTRHGFKPEQVLGKRPDELIPPDEAAELMTLLNRALHTGATVQGEVSGHTRGVRWVYDVTAEPLRDTAGRVIGLTIANIDIAERKQREAQLQQLNRTLRAHTHSDQALMRATTEAQYLAEVCQIIVEDCGHTMVWIGFADDDEARTVRPMAHAGFEIGYLETLNITWADTERGRGPTGTAIRTGQPSACRNMLTDPNFAPWREEALRRGYASSIVFPLLADGRAFGAITIYSKEADPFSEAEVQLLAALADDLAYGIQTIRLRVAHARAEEALRNAHAELEQRVQDRTRQLAQANEELNKEIAERERAENQLRLQMTAVRAAANGIVITDRQGSIQWCNPAFTRMTGYESTEALGQSFRLLNSGQQSAEFYRAMWDAIVSGKIWQGELVNRRKDGRVYIEEQTIAPVHNERGEITHFIAIKHDITERKQAETRLERYTQDLLAISQAERAQRQLAETLSAANQALTQSLNLETVLETLLDYVGQMVPYDSANVMLLETESRLAVRVVRGYERWGDPAVVHAATFNVQTNPIFELLLTTRQSCLIADTRTHPGWETRPGVEHVRSWLGVPLIAGGYVIGLYSLDKIEPDYFTPEHQRLAEMLVGQAAVAIQNAWLFEQVRAGRERLQSLSRRLVEAQEAERHYVARELHDEAGQALTSLLFGLRQLEAQWADAALGPQVTELKQITNSLFDSLHRLAADLRPASLDHLGLVPVLQQYVKAMGDRYGLLAQFKALGFSSERLSVEIETALYRIVQEALTNIGRHARATRADVLLERRGDRVVVVVEDNGLGFDAEISRFAQDGHLGLVGMQERVEMLGGSLTIESAAGAGTTLVVEVPNDHSHSDR